MQLNRVELSQKHIECFVIRALSEPYEIVAHHTALQFNLYLDLPLSLDFGLFFSRNNNIKKMHFHYLL